MKTVKIKIFVLCIGIVLISSCVTNKKLTYLQSTGPREEFIAITPATYIIQPYDNLYIRIITPDPELGEMFNTMTTASGSMNINELSADILSYTVDDAGIIELPYAGKFVVG